MTTLRPGSPRSHILILAVMFTLVVALSVTGPISGRASSISSASLSASAPVGLHVVGRQLLDSTNQPLILRGVNRSGTEYACIQGWGFFDGPSDAASAQAISAGWGANAVRIPLNEDCWLNINGAPPSYSGAAYQNAISSYVGVVQAAGLVPILELHWSGAGSTQATGQQPMPNRDHSLTFWQQVANYYRTNTGVIFDLHNEPYPDGNRDTAAAWDCWKNGTTSSNASSCPGGGLSYQAAGMQELVSTVRGSGGTGATNVIMLGGVQYSNALSQWLTYKPQDPAGNLMAAWHVYNFNVCSSPTCYDATAAPVASSVPLVTAEIGENDCGTGMLNTLMSWLDAHNSGYLAWTWDTWGTACANLSLITDYSGTPTSYGQVYKDHLASVVNTTPTPVQPTPTMATGQRFTDVPPGALFYAQINWCYDRGIISGYSNGDGTLSFRPATNSTRAQVSKILVNAEGWRLVSPGTPHFTDVPVTHPFYAYVETAYSHGLISGYSDGTFRPQSNVTRAQIAKMIVQAQGWSPSTLGGPHFTDVPVTNAFYTFVETAYNHNVISGYADGTFRPNNNLTRGQLAKLIYGMLTSP